MPKKLTNKKPRYNLNLVLQETGIKADTLRAWERRYHLPQPQRTEGGHRLFSDYDIETIKWLITRQEEGLSISRAVNLWREIESIGQDPVIASIKSILDPNVPGITTQEYERVDGMRYEWVQACLDFDEPVADQILSQSFAQFSLETVCTEILQAGLAHIGSLWYEGAASVQQEHFASELATRRLQSLILAAPQPMHQGSILVGCPQDEAHTFSALLITLFLRYRGWNVTYLGAKVPQEKLKETIEKTNPDLVVMTSMRLATSARLFEMAKLLNKLNVPLAFGGLIFNHFPDLPKIIPGHYLGDKLVESISIIENLLTSPMPQINLKSETKQFSKAIAHFVDKRQHIEIDTLDQVKEKFGPDFPLKSIQDANNYLAQDLLAALCLGDISLLGSNIEWVQNLLANFNIPGKFLSHYLLAYRNAAERHLEEPGQPIVDWLTSTTNKI
ncbi:MAG: cobalamin-dependent protein [Anaerolineae bacterium]|nr:cobalamin-dependent protein [Anaerolineae bacterium]